MTIVSVIRTDPKRVSNDYRKLMDLCEYRTHIDKDLTTLIKLNLSWTKYYPACSTEPWQLEAVARTLVKDRYKKLIAVENQTVVTHPWKGAYYNKWLPILKKNQIEFLPLTDVKWIPYSPRSDMLAMYDIFNSKEDQILIPKIFQDTNIIHLPTLKTHGHTVMTGAMKNAFGGLIPKYRHHAHKKIHEILVDLLAIQKEIHKGIFAITDGTVCGNGAGPRVMEPFPGNIILASADQVAIDAVSARIMGFDPMKIDFLKIAHDRGLGIADIDQIEIAGIESNELKKINFDFKTKKSLIIRWDQRIRKSTQNLGWLHKFLFRSPFFRSFIFASEFYHDYVWYPTIGTHRINAFSQTDWGCLFKRYKYGKFPQFDEVKNWDPY